MLFTLVDQDEDEEFLACSASELHHKTVANAFWNCELEQELRELNWENYRFFKRRTERRQ